VSDLSYVITSSLEVVINLSVSNVIILVPRSLAQAPSVRLAEVILTTVPKHLLSHYCIWRCPTLFDSYLPEASFKSLKLLIKFLKITVD